MNALTVNSPDVAFPEMLDPAGSLELRTVKALERVATALEQLVLQNLPQAPETAPAGRELQPWDLPPTPVVAPAALPYQPPVAVTTIQAPAPWVCPVHHKVKTVPAGVSKKTGNSYDAFLACPEPGCDQKPARR